MAETNVKANEGAAKAPSNAQNQRIAALEEKIEQLLAERNAPAPVDPNDRREVITTEEIASQSFTNEDLVKNYDLDKAAKEVNATPAGEEPISFNVRGGQGDSKAYLVVAYSNGTKVAKEL